MRQVYTAAEKLFIDSAGPTIGLTDGARANIFVAALGASSYTFAYATPRQGMADWLDATARVRSPPDKAKVESAVQVVERWILARLRRQRFNSVHEVNQAIAPLLEGLNLAPLPEVTR